MNQQIDDGKFGELIRNLRKIQLIITRDEKTKHLVDGLQEAETWLKEYIEPWQCPDCGWFGKVPENALKPRLCGHCGSGRCFPYSYLEVERVSRQFNLLLQCVTYYAKKNNGHMAQETLKKVGSVKLSGSFETPQDVGVPAAGGTKFKKKIGTPHFLLKKLKVWGK